MQPILTTSRLLVRPLTPDDARPLHRIWGDHDVIWWGPSQDLDETAERLARILDRSAEMPDGLGWWLLVHDEAVVGDVVLQTAPWDPEVVEVGWHLAREAWGQGYATEAASAVLRHAFETVGLSSVDAIVAETNDRSLGVAERLGMSRIGSLEHAGRPHERFRIGPDEVRHAAADEPGDGVEMEHSPPVTDDDSGEHR